MQVATVSANVALTTVAAIIAEMGEVNPGPNSLVRVNVPNVTGLAAGATVTIAILRIDTGATIGSATATNTGAGAGAVGGITAEAPVPVGMAGGIEVTGVVSASTGTVVASAASPVTITQEP